MILTGHRDNLCTAHARMKYKPIETLGNVVIQLFTRFLLFSAAMLPMDTSMGRVWVTRECTIPPRHAKGFWTSFQFIINHFRAAYVTSRRSCVFFDRNSVGILFAKRCWTLGTSASRWHYDINASTHGIRSVFWQNEGHWQIPGLHGCDELRGPSPRKHEVGYGTGSHAITRRSQHNRYSPSESQVFCQADATKMTAKFAVVRADIMKPE